jgi:2-hydroxy-3-oxopropionate reductase
MQVGFIGLGIMGSPMAANLIKGGHQLFLYSIPSIPQPLVEAGGKACANGQEVAQKADIIITMVPTRHVDAALFSEKASQPGRRGKDRRRREFDLAARDQGVREEDQRARLRISRCTRLWRRSGREGGVAAVGGSEATFARVKPLFS